MKCGWKGGERGGGAYQRSVRGNGAVKKRSQKVQCRVVVRSRGDVCWRCGCVWRGVRERDSVYVERWDVDVGCGHGGHRERSRIWDRCGER